jgi:hypothetical protein
LALTISAIRPRGRVDMLRDVAWFWQLGIMLFGAFGALELYEHDVVGGLLALVFAGGLFWMGRRFADRRRIDEISREMRLEEQAAREL